MFRKNHLSSALAVSTILFSTMSVNAHINYMRDRWRDAVNSDHISDLYIGLQGAYVMSTWDDVRQAYDGRQGTFRVSSETDLDPAGLPLNSSSTIDYIKSKFDSANWAGRAFIRWDFTKYFGIESGISFIDGSEYALTNIGGPADVFDQDGVLLAKQVPSGGTIIKDKGTTVILDLSWVTRVPLENSFIFYTKFGADLMWQKNGLTSRVVDQAGAPRPPGLLFVEGDDKTNISFTFGLGLNYEFSSAWMGDLSWQYFRGNPEVGDFMPDINLFSVGISYHINMARHSRDALGEM